jgi:2-amino-4-hydroxy-6-hydroxymethyldihydropteridine diphosphokinase
MATSNCCIGLGGNTGPVAETFATALREMCRRGVGVRDVSGLYRTGPMGTASAPYLNACVTAVTELPPHELLEILKQIEAAAGRRPSERWSARPLDLDVLLIDEQSVRTPTLTVPHPGVVYRRFVLDPLSDVSAAAVVPPTMLTVAELRTRLLRRPLPIALAGGTAKDRARIAGFIQGTFPAVQLVAENEGPRSSSDATILMLDEVAARLNESGRVSVSVERGLVTLDAAVQAMLNAMLDEPQRMGTLRLG